MASRKPTEPQMDFMRRSTGTDTTHPSWMRRDTASDPRNQDISFSRKAGEDPAALAPLFGPPLESAFEEHKLDGEFGAEGSWGTAEGFLLWTSLRYGGQSSPSTQTSSPQNFRDLFQLEPRRRCPRRTSRPRRRAPAPPCPRPSEGTRQQQSPNGTTSRPSMTWTASLAPCRPLNLLLPRRKTSGSIFPTNPRKTQLRNCHPGPRLRPRRRAARPSLPARCPRRWCCKTLPRSFPSIPTFRMIPPSPSPLPKISGRVKEPPRRPLRRPPTARWSRPPDRPAVPRPRLAPERRWPPVAPPRRRRPDPRPGPSCPPANPPSAMCPGLLALPSTPPALLR
ncbi:hypothetical protein RLOC_00003920 [Lonchura striata]|uniref:Uncharacterized protein n=1 Tax=Lonchura striata TaxID=40157 RepID=A0A218UKF8_9PASE|nr:hypothetical protein RLOC_00003920 [Lonchura striata domestica]